MCFSWLFSSSLKYFLLKKSELSGSFRSKRNVFSISSFCVLFCILSVIKVLLLLIEISLLFSLLFFWLSSSTLLWLLLSSKFSLFFVVFSIFEKIELLISDREFSNYLLQKYFLPLTIPLQLKSRSVSFFILFWTLFFFLYKSRILSLSSSSKILWYFW